MTLSPKVQAWLGTPRLTSKADILALSNELANDGAKRHEFFTRAASVRATLNEPDRALLDEVTDSITAALKILK